MDKILNDLSAVLSQKRLTFGFAESCTGGMISSLVTEIPGISEYFYGSVVSYSNSIKTCLLKVDSHTIDLYGAVSRECVEQMADGLIDLMNVDCAVSVSGIAGPGGGSAEKPVGTVWFCFIVDNRRKAEKKFFSGNRQEIRKSASYYAITVMTDMMKAFKEG